MKTKTLRWLTANPPATAQIIAGHLLGLGEIPIRKTNQILRELKREGLVEVVDAEERPYQWRATPSLLRNPALMARIIPFPREQRRAA